MKIVLVYVGNEAPEYVYKNLEYLKKVVGINPVLIADNPKTLSKCHSKGINTWEAPNSKEALSDVFSQMQHPKEFRTGFWFNTVARFGSLAAFLQTHPGESVLQVESDVWLSPEFPFKKFNNLECQIAFGLETPTTGSAALLYLRDGNSANQLLEEVRKEFSHNPFATDMTILGKVHTESLLETMVLPSLPIDYDQALIYADELTTYEISRHSEYFGGVFDPLTLGLFLTGEDPKNHRGFVRMYRNNPFHNFGVGSNELSIGKTGLPRFGVDSHTPVFSIHNHAKENELFTASKYLRYLQSQIMNSMNGPHTVFKGNVFLSQLWNSLKRRVKRYVRR